MLAVFKHVYLEFSCDEKRGAQHILNRIHSFGIKSSLAMNANWNCIDVDRNTSEDLEKYTAKTVKHGGKSLMV